MAFLLSFHTTTTPLYLSTSKTPLLPLRSSLHLSAQSLSSPTTTSNRTSSSSSSGEFLLCRNSTAISCVLPGRASHWQKSEGEMKLKSAIFKGNEDHLSLSTGEVKMENENLLSLHALLLGVIPYLELTPEAHASVNARMNSLFEIGALFELGIQLTYLLILLALLGFGTFFVIRQVLIRRELDLSAKELQEQVRSGDATATEYFELGAVMLRRKFYPAAIKYLQQAVEKWDGDPQDLAQVYNALGVSYIREEKLEKGIQELENAVKLQPGYVRAWNNLGDAYEKKKDLRNALKAFEEVLVFDPNNKVARPRRDALKERVRMFEGVPLKSEDK